MRKKELNSIDPVEPVAELATNKTQRKQHKLFDVVKTDKTPKLKYLLKEWSLSSSFQCLTKLYQYESRLIRILWLIIFIIFSFGTFWFFINGILDYLEFDVVSKIRVYNEETLVYPLVTFCGYFPFTSKKSDEIFSDFIYDKNTTIFSLNYQKTSVGSKEYNDYITKYYSYITYGMKKAYYMNESSKRELGYNLKDIVLFCQFNGQVCDEKDFIWVFSYWYGNCFQFNPNLNHKNGFNLAGANYGLMIIFKNLTNLNKYSWTNGLRVFIHNNSDFVTSAEQVFIETGKMTFLQLKKTFSYREPSPYSQCQNLKFFKSKAFDSIKGQNSQYHQNDCLDLCMQNFIIDKCKCFSTFYYAPINISFPPCFSPNEAQCLRNYIQAEKTKVQYLCSRECPLECDYVKYDMTLSTMGLAGKEFIDNIRLDLKEYANLSIDEFQRTHLYLGVYYSSKEYTEIREVPKVTIVDLISLLGGVLGIFLGFSVFSLVEILEVLIRVVALIFGKRLTLI
jgi:hypothetical protein